MAAVVEGVGKTGSNQAGNQLQQRRLAIILLHKLQHKLNTSANKTVPFTSLTSPTQSGELKVAASTANDFPGLKNTTNATLRVSFKATGQWCLYSVPTTDPELVIFNSPTDWKGLRSLSSYNKYKWKAYLLMAGSLVAELKDPQGSFLLMMSAPSYIELAPGCSVEFFMNEDPRWVADNSGEISLSYTCAPAAPTPPPVLKNHQGDAPPLSPEGSRVAPGKVISYAGIDFYPLLYTNIQGFRNLALVGFKDGKIVKSFGVGGPGNELLSDIAIEPESEMVNFTTVRGAMMRLPWSSLADTIPTPAPRMVVGRRAENSNSFPWIITSFLQINGFYTTDGKGNISLLKAVGSSKTLNLIIPGNFGGNEFTDLLFYDPTTGDAEFRTTDGKGTITQLKTHTGWRKSFSVITPGNFGGNESTDLLFYDPTTGEAEFHTTDGSGNISLLKKHSGWRKTWSLMIPGNFGGNSFTDLLLYDRTSGDAEFYTTDGNGNIALLKKYTGWRKTWSLIIPGNFGGNEYTDLLFFDPTAGEAEIFTTDGNGNMTLLKMHTGLRKSFTMVIPGNFGGNEYTDLLFYDPTVGEGEIYTTDGAGNLALLKKQGGWRKTWQSIIPGNFSASSFTSLFFNEPVVDEG